MTIIEMDDIDDFCLENPLLRILLMSSRREHVNAIFVSRKKNGEYHRLFEDLLNEPNKFFEYFRMSPETFFYILRGIEKYIRKESNFRECISPEERLSITLRFLSTGMSFRALSFSYRVSHVTIRKIVYATCLAIWNYFHGKHMPFPSTENLKSIASDFFQNWNFPHCIGCIDGKHIRIRCPHHSGSLYYNYKQYFSIVLQGIADSKYRFITIDVGAYGKQSDAGIFTDTNVFKRLETNTFNVPANENIPSTNISAPFVLLGDEAYPLKTYLLKPYSRKNLTPEEQIFNYRLSRARRCVECAFGILVAKWRCLKTEMHISPENVDIVIKCICLLHNIIINREGVVLSCHNNNPTPRRNLPVSRRYNNYGRSANHVREVFKNYFVSPEGEIPFQYV